MASRLALRSAHTRPGPLLRCAHGAGYQLRRQVAVPAVPGTVGGGRLSRQPGFDVPRGGQVPATSGSGSATMPRSTASSNLDGAALTSRRGMSSSAIMESTAQPMMYTLTQVLELVASTIAAAIRGAGPPAMR